MARVKVSAELVADMLFGFAEMPITVSGARFSDLRNTIEFEIDGPDLPAGEIIAEVTVQSNRRGERFHRMTFRPAS